MTDIPDKSSTFVLILTGLLGGLFGLIIGIANGLGVWGLIIGSLLAILVSFIGISFSQNEIKIKYIICALLVIGFFYYLGPIGILLGVSIGWFFGWFLFWLFHKRYRANLQPYLSQGQVLWHYTFRIICGVIFVFLITPILVVMPLSFNAQDFFTFTPEMLQFDPEGYSLKHYRDFFTNNEWQRSFKNSLLIAPIATLVSVSLGTLAAIGLSQSHVPFKRAITAILISPMIVPLIISATGMFFFYSHVGNFLEGTIGLDKNFVGYVKVILAHSVLGIPFVIITVTATLVGFDSSLTKAAANMGANPIKTFFKIQMPLILPGVISGGLFAFITSFDEVVVVMFVGSTNQKTLPWQMFTGLREQISPTILAVATILVAISIALLITLEMLRRRSERLRGITPS
jgi:putative spermidine/putrescine transport system permease protein|tara:strand:- start:1062 stop:2264 length:1203 start_codon:yes stop_codon:yes gene_type:complete